MASVEDDRNESDIVATLCHGKVMPHLRLKQRAHFEDSVIQEVSRAANVSPGESFIRPRLAIGLVGLWSGYAFIERNSFRSLHQVELARYVFKTGDDVRRVKWMSGVSSGGLHAGVYVVEMYS